MTTKPASDPKPTPEIPAFGDWKNTENLTEKFEGARKQKKNSGTTGDPNNSKHNPEAPRMPPSHATSYGDPRDQKPKNPPHVRRAETDVTRSTASPLHHESAPRKRMTNPPRQQYKEQGSNGTSHKSPSRPSVGDASPLQGATPSRIKHGHGSSTPGRIGTKHGGRGYETTEDDVAVPRFGEWDDSNAASGDGYTGIFQRIRDDRLSPNTSARQLSPTDTRRHTHSTGCRCTIL